MTLERRKPHETPADPEITAEVRDADEEARQEALRRRAELLERMRNV